MKDSDLQKALHKIDLEEAILEKTWSGRPIYS
jgi:hypothetical protein